MSERNFFVTLVRHGQTSHNKLKLIQGQMESELNDVGRLQAELLAQYFQKNGHHYDKIYSSDLIRAFETCEIITQKRHPIIKNQLLRERSFGVIQGKSFDILKSEAYKAGYTQNNYTQFCPEGGETMDQVKERVKEFVNEVLCRQLDGAKEVLVVTHGGVVREFMKFFTGINCHIDSKDLIVTPNTGINKFLFHINQNKLSKVEPIFLHHIPHLQGEARFEAVKEEQLNDKSEHNKDGELAI